MEQALSYELTSQHMNRNAVTLAHDLESTKKIFEIARYFHRRLTGGDTEGTQRAFRFHGGDSHYWVGTAGSKSFGRGQTLQRAHWSEAAFTTGDIDEQRNLLFALTEAASRGEVVLETTANGAAGLFWEVWNSAKKGEGSFTPIFIPWFWDADNVIPLFPHEVDPIMRELSTEESNLVEGHGVNAEQIAWRRQKKSDLKRQFPQEYPEDDITCFLMSGECYFDQVTIGKILPQCRHPIETRRVPGGTITIWEEARADCDYIIGTDTAEGVPTGDYSASCVLNEQTGEQVARLYGHWRAHEHADHLMELARRYATKGQLPFQAVERNVGEAILHCLVRERKYPLNRMFFSQVWDPLKSRKVKRVGWNTDTKTRADMLQGVARAIEDGGMTINDREFLHECLTFVNTGTRWEADEGCHDDLIFAWGIAWQVRSKPRTAPLLVL